jgi:hypothetical protein
LIQLADFTAAPSAEAAVNQLVCGLAKEMNRSIRIRELSPAWMVTAKRINISPIQRGAIHAMRLKKAEVV